VECTAVMAVEREKRRNELFKYWKEKRPNTKEEGSKDRTCVSFVFFWGEGNYNFFFFCLFVCVCGNKSTRTVMETVGTTALVAKT
jgi:hypothetical protein